MRHIYTRIIDCCRWSPPKPIFNRLRHTTNVWTYYTIYVYVINDRIIIILEKHKNRLRKQTVNTRVNNQKQKANGIHNNKWERWSRWQNNVPCLVPQVNRDRCKCKEKCTPNAESHSKNANILIENENNYIYEFVLLPSWANTTNTTG